MAIKTFKPGVGPGSSAAEQHIDLPTQQEPTVKEEAVSALDALIEDNQTAQPEPQINVPSSPPRGEGYGVSPEMRQQLDESKQMRNEQKAAAFKEEQRIKPLSEKLGSQDVDSFDEFMENENDPIGKAIVRSDRINDLFQKEAQGSAYLGQSKQYYNEFTDVNEEGLTKSEANPNKLNNILLDPKLVDAGLQYQDGAVRIDPLFSRVAGLTTLQFIGDPEANTDPDLLEEDTLDNELEEADANAPANRAQNAAKLGKAIYREWKRELNRITQQPTSNFNPNALTNDQFTILGTAFKELFAKANPDLYQRNHNFESGQIEFTLTPEGSNLIRQMKKQRPDAFLNQEIAPSPVPRNSVSEEFKDDVAKILHRETTTGVKGQRRSRQTEEQIKNANSIAHVVDPTRRKIYLQLATTALKQLSPIVGAAKNSPYPIDPKLIPPEADLLDIGKDRLQSFVGEEQRLQSDQTYLKDVEAGNRPAYNAKDQYINFVLNFIQDLNTISKYSNRPNHLDFGVQLLQNRTHVLQNRFNPQGNTTIRALVGSGKPTTWKPGKGSDVDQLFKEQLAIFFSKEAKALLPENRVKEFNKLYSSGALQTYIDMGKSIEDTLLTPQEDTAMTGIYTNAYNPATPNQFNLQPAYQNEKPLPSNVIKEAAKHGKEGPLFIEAMRELYRYDQARKNGTNMISNMGVEFDGKTHGPATNATQLGLIKSAFRIGLLRREGATKNLDSFTVADLLEKKGIDSTTEHAAGDLRDAMRDYILANGSNYAVEWSKGNEDVASVMTAIYKLAVQDRDNYLKKPPMVLGYGKLLKNLNGEVSDTIFNGPQSQKIGSLINSNRKLLEKINPDASAEASAISFLHDMLADSIYSELDPAIISVGQTLRANNLLASLSNEMIAIKNAIGSTTYIGANQMQPKGEVGYMGKGLGRVELMEEVAAGSAEREGKPGGWGRGRVIPAVIQGIDGAWMNRMFTNSWPQLKKAYMLPIMDAVKTDLKSGSMVRKHANANWIQANKDFSYVEAIMEEWAPATMKKIEDTLNSIDSIADINVGPDTNFRMFGWLASSTLSNKGNLYPKNLKDTLYDTMEFPDKPKGMSVAKYEATKADKAFKVSYDIMTKAGIHPQTEMTQLTGEQMKILYSEILKAINLKSRNSNTAAKTRENRRELFTRASKQRTLQIDLG